VSANAIEQTTVKSFILVGKEFCVSIKRRFLGCLNFVDFNVIYESLLLMISICD